MKTAIAAVAVLLGLLSVAAGAAKVALLPDEAAFLHPFGFTDAQIMTFGLVQVLGGVLLVVPRTRSVGALICASGFTLSAALLLFAGNLVFGSMSLLPAVLAGLVALSGIVVNDA